MSEGVKAVFASPFAGPVECLVIRKLPPVDVWQWWDRYECRVVGDATRGWAGGTRFECFEGELFLRARFIHDEVLYTGSPNLSALKEASVPSPPAMLVRNKWYVEAPEKSPQDSSSGCIGCAFYRDYSCTTASSQGAAVFGGDCAERGVIYVEVAR